MKIHEKTNKIFFYVFLSILNFILIKDQYFDTLIFVSLSGITQGLTFGTPTTMITGTGFGLGGSVTTPPISTVSSLPSFTNLTSSATPLSVPSGLSFDAAKTSTIATTGFSLATTTAGGLSFGTSKPTDTFLGAI